MALTTINADVCAHFFSRLAPRYDVRPRLSKIGSPTLVIVGRHDWVCPPAAGRVLATAIPNTHLVELDTGHFGFSETPGPNPSSTPSARTSRGPRRFVAGSPELPAIMASASQPHDLGRPARPGNPSRCGARRDPASGLGRTPTRRRPAALRRARRLRGEVIEAVAEGAPKIMCRSASPALRRTLDLTRFGGHVESGLRSLLLCQQEPKTEPLLGIEK